MLVKTRYDALPGFVVVLTVCSRRVGAVPGGPLEFVLFNWTGGGCTGYHYDLLVRRRGPAGATMRAVIELDSGDEESAGHGGGGASGSVDAGMHDTSAAAGAEKGGVTDASGGSGGTEAVSGGRPLSLESTPVKSPPRKVQRVCAECKDVFEDAEDVRVPTSVETPVQSPVVKCPRCGPSPAGVAGAGVADGLVTGLAPVPAMPFGSRGADEAVEDPRGGGSRWRRFTPRVIDESLCMARLWADGLGGQCKQKPCSGSDLCTLHFKQDSAGKLKHGRVDGEIPQRKLEEFERKAKSGISGRLSRAGFDVAGSSSTSLAKGPAGTEQREGGQRQLDGSPAADTDFAAGGKSEGRVWEAASGGHQKRASAQKAAERRAEAAGDGAEAGKGREVDDVSAADRSAEAVERRDEVDDVSDVDLQRLVQEFVERRRAVDERARNVAAMSGSIAVNEDDVLQVRRAFSKEQELGAVLARILGAVHGSGAEVGARVKLRYASDFKVKVQMYRIQGGGRLGRS